MVKTKGIGCELQDVVDSWSLHGFQSYHSNTIPTGTALPCCLTLGFPYMVMLLLA